MHRHFRGIVVLVFVAALAPLGCRSPDEKVPAPVAHTPLDVDPMDRHEFTGWWTNGEQLLRLSPDASYALWSGLNRYHRPHERGRWSKQSYAVLRLEAYTRYRSDPHRVSVVRVGENIGIRLPAVAGLPSLEPMTMIDRPPRMPEDELFGSWSGDAGTLRLDPTMRYSFSPRAAGTREPLVLAGHEGRWQLVDNVVELRPDAPGIEVISLPLIDRNDSRSLSYAAGDFHFQP